MKSAARLAALLVAVLALPVSADPEDDSFSTFSIRTTGSASVDGALLVLELAAADAGLRADATHLDVRIESSTSLRTMGVHEHRSEEPRVRSHAHGNVTLTAVPWSEGASLYAVPTTPGAVRLAMRAQSLRIAPQAVECHAQPQHFLGQQVDACRGLAGSQQVTDADAQAVDLSGGARVTLWGWNVTVADEAGTVTYWSGQADRPAVDGAPKGAVVNSTTQVLTLWLRNGDLEFLGGLGDPVMLATTALVLETDGTTVIEGAVGSDGGPAPERVDGAFRATVQSEGTHLVVDPQPAAAVAADLRGQRIGWASAAGAVGAALLAVALARRARPATKGRLAAALEARRHGHAASLAMRLGGGHGQGVQVMRAVALLRAGRAGEAEAMLKAMACATEADLAAREYLLALARALQHDADEAADHLATATRVAPEYRAEAAMNSTLAPLLARIPAGRGEDGYA